MERDVTIRPAEPRVMRPAFVVFRRPRSARRTCSSPTPLANHTAVQWLRGRGYTIDPLIVSFLADWDWLKVDRWIHTGISYTS